ncbi:hypothetical protein GCM10027422_21100 [Hymenobacter arcticus]
MLQSTTVPIKYGLPDIDISYIKAEQKLFPNSNNAILGGCVVGAVTQERLLYCEQCRTARQQWLAKHKPRK